MNIGPTPVRISPDENPEVVWCDRIDPCRARIRSVPLPESGRRYDDLLLHDGESRGKREIDGRSVSVFDELAVLETSPFATYEVIVRCADPEEVEAVMRQLREAELGVEDWTGNLRMLCEACSLGEPHDHDGDERTNFDWNPERRFGVAARAVSDLRPLRRGYFWWRRGVLAVRRVL